MMSALVTTTKQQHGITHALLCEFKNKQERDYYVEKDPAHQAFKKTISDLVEKMLVVDISPGAL
jgi:stress responsive alpha/beta barrel protein